MKAIAIIPARSGSKRIPNKNIKEFHGRPIITYIIEKALKAKLFDTVMVSTDSDKIAEIAIKYGATVPFMRSKLNANDYATTSAVLIEVLEEYQNRKINFDLACCLYPTSVLPSIEKLKEGHSKILNYDLDCVFSISKYNNPIQRSFVLNDENLIKVNSPEYINVRTQDLQTNYHDVGQFYWLNVSRFLKVKDLWNSNIGVVELTEMEAQDIDTEEDWKMSELKYMLQIDKQSNEII